MLQGNEVDGRRKTEVNGSSETSVSFEQERDEIAPHGSVLSDRCEMHRPGNIKDGCSGPRSAASGYQLLSPCSYPALNRGSCLQATGNLWSYRCLAGASRASSVVHVTQAPQILPLKSSP